MRIAKSIKRKQLDKENQLLYIPYCEIVTLFCFIRFKEYKIQKIIIDDFAEILNEVNLE